MTIADLPWDGASPEDRMLVERFLAHVDSSAGEDACWPWRGRLASGYGRLEFGGRYFSAHRLAWQLANGEEDLGSLYVCHTCDNPPCVNPAHLFVGTAADNNHDMMRKGRARFMAKPPRGERNGSAKLNAEMVRYIRTSGVSNARLALEMGVHFSTVRRVRLGETWTHV